MVRIVFDSTIDPCIADGLLAKVQNNSNFALITTTDDSDLFDSFNSVAVKKPSKDGNFYDGASLRSGSTRTGGARHLRSLE